MEKKTLSKIATLYIDQYGNTFYAKTLKRLKEKVGPGRVAKMYINNKAGNTFHTGYVIGNHWLTAYRPVRVEE